MPTATTQAQEEGCQNDNSDNETESVQDEWWMEVVDPHMGQHYCYHSVTRETNWQ